MVFSMYDTPKFACKLSLTGTDWALRSIRVSLPTMRVEIFCLLGSKLARISSSILGDLGLPYRPSENKSSSR